MTQANSSAPGSVAAITKHRNYVAQSYIYFFLGIFDIHPEPQKIQARYSACTRLRVLDSSTVYNLYATRRGDVINQQNFSLSSFRVVHRFF